MFDGATIDDKFNELITSLINNEVLESYLYEYNRVDENNSYDVDKFSKIYLTQNEIIKASYVYNEKKILGKIYIERSLIKNMEIKLKYTYRLNGYKKPNLIDIKSINNFNLPNLAIEKFEEDYRKFLIRFYELHLDD